MARPWRPFHGQPLSLADSRWWANRQRVEIRREITVLVQRVERGYVAPAIPVRGPIVNYPLPKDPEPSPPGRFEGYVIAPCYVEALKTWTPGPEYETAEQVRRRLEAQQDRELRAVMQAAARRIKR